MVKDRYRLVEALAAGSMGAVWRALDTTSGRTVAVKIAGLECLRDPTFRERSLREAGRLARLDHPHVARVLDVGEDDGFPFAVLDHLSGGNLREHVERVGGPDRRLPLADVATWVVPLADALDFVHAHGVVHRDVKPENVLFAADGRVVLVDFGIAKEAGRERSLTPSDTLVGSAVYVAPEGVREEPVTGAFDQYGLATMVYEALCGEPPWSGPLGAMLRAKALEDAPCVSTRRPDAQVPAHAAAALRRALARSPRDRFPSCAAFARALVGA